MLLLKNIKSIVKIELAMMISLKSHTLPVFNLTTHLRFLYCWMLYVTIAVKRVEKVGCAFILELIQYFLY